MKLQQPMKLQPLHKSYHHHYEEAERLHRCEAPTELLTSYQHHHKKAKSPRCTPERASAHDSWRRTTIYITRLLTGALRSFSITFLPYKKGEMLWLNAVFYKSYVFILRRLKKKTKKKLNSLPRGHEAIKAD